MGKLSNKLDLPEYYDPNKQKSRWPTKIVGSTLVGAGVSLASLATYVLVACLDLL